MKGGQQFSRCRLTLRHGRGPHGPEISSACLRRLALCIMCSAQLYCAVQHRTCRSVLQPTLGVSSLTWAVLRGGLFSRRIIVRHRSCGPEMTVTQAQVRQPARDQARGAKSVYAVLEGGHMALSKTDLGG